MSLLEAASLSFFLKIIKRSTSSFKRVHILETSCKILSSFHLIPFLTVPGAGSPHELVRFFFLSAPFFPAFSL